jgi:hypothetical protein
MDEKERFEILLRHMDERFDILVDGQNALLKQMKNLTYRISSIDAHLQRVEFNTKYLDAIYGVMRTCKRYM